MKTLIIKKSELKTAIENALYKSLNLEFSLYYNLVIQVETNTILSIHKNVSDRYKKSLGKIFEISIVNGWHYSYDFEPTEHLTFNESFLYEVFEYMNLIEYMYNDNKEIKLING